jgi:hypothetical protein
MQLTGKQNLFQNEKLNLLIISIAAAVVILPVLFYGIPDGYDLPHHLQCAQTYVDAVKSGNFYPSWSADRNFGYGGLEIRMYPPVSHYVLALFKIAAGNWHTATWATYTFWSLLGCFGIYFWAREFVAPPAALFAALLFAVIPYRVNEVFQTFLYAEFAGGSILPFCFAFLTRILKPRSESAGFAGYFSRDALGFAVAVAALILTHLPLTLIGIIGLGVYFLTQTKWNPTVFLANAVKVSIGGILGLALSAFFWIKVVEERAMMAKTSVYDEIVINYKLNFLLTFLQTFEGAAWHVSFLPAFYDLILLVTILIVLPMAIFGLLKEYNREKSGWRGVWLTFAFSLFIATVLSKPLWDHLPLLFEVQFPWRWLNIVSIFAPVLAAGGAAVCLRRCRDEKTRTAPVLIFGLLVMSIALSLSWSVSAARYIAPAQTEAQAQKFIEAEGFRFWWTIWTREEFKQTTGKVSADNRAVTLTNWEVLNRNFTIEAGAPQNVRVALFYHPNWHVSVNNQAVAPGSDPTGALTFPVPAEKSEVALDFVETKKALAARKVSFASIFVLVFLFLATLKSNKQKI